MQGNLSVIIRQVLQLTLRHKLFVVSVFVLVNVVALYAGYNWPKKFTSYTTIYIEEENILGPLMQGTAVQTDVVDRGRIARELLYGRQILMQIVKIGGWDKLQLTPSDQERLMDEIKKRTTITTVGQNLIRISYQDPDPERAYIVTKGYADLFIRGTLAEKAKESKGAFDFIDNQVKIYESKLKDSEEALKTFRSNNTDFQEGAVQDVNRNISQYRTRLEELKQQLLEAEIRRSTLESQLSGETETAAGISRVEQIQARIGQLQTRLDTLLLSYHETYPDIIQLKTQIAELRELLKKEQQRRILEKNAAETSGHAYIDESVRANPIYQQLQGDLYDTKTQIAMLKVRMGETQRLLQKEIERAKRIAEAEATLSALTRDYNVNQEVYQDLLRRRENARVSMNLDLQHEGMSISISEPAFYPHTPTGPRYLHFVIGGLFLGVAIPIGVLFGLQQVMPKVLSAADLKVQSDVEVLGEFVHFTTRHEKRRALATNILLIMTMTGVFIAIAVISVQRLQNG